MSVNANKSLTNSNERIIGIDLVKIIAIFLVTLLHITGIGGAVDAAENPLSKFVLCSLEGVSFSCINLFALSTGFLYYGTKTHFSRLIGLWFQVVFWAILANIGPAAYLKDLSILTETPFVRIFVVSFCTYWYFTAYFALFFFIPLFNYAIKKISEKHFIFFLFSSLVIFGILPFLFNNDLFQTVKGYSFVWLSIIYLIGAGFRKFNFNQRIKTSFLALTVFITCLLQSIIAFLSNSRSLTFMGVDYNKTYENYNFIVTLALSISLFLLISKIRISGKNIRKFIITLSSASFSVYLIQCNHSVMETFIENQLGFIGSFSPTKALAAAVGISLAIYIAFTLLGILQNYIFKLLHINKLCRTIESIFIKIFNTFYSKILCRCVHNNT